MEGFLSFVLIFMVFNHIGVVISDRNPLPLITIKVENAFERGFALGKTLSVQIRDAITEDPSINSLLKWANGVNSSIWKDIWDRQVKWYPQYVEEIRGMAKGKHMYSV